jgi:NADH dehydrogenase (ubiquinone) 1 alpha subcomplex subunit 9
MVLLPDFNIRSDDEIKRAISCSNVVVNCIGMRLETKNFAFQDVHVDFPTRLAK